MNNCFYLRQLKWLLLGSPMLMDPHPSQQHIGLHYAVWQPQQEVTRPKPRFKTTLPKKSGVDGGAHQVPTWFTPKCVLEKLLIAFATVARWSALKWWNTELRANLFLEVKFVRWCRSTKCRFDVSSSNWWTESVASKLYMLVWMRADPIRSIGYNWTTKTISKSTSLLLLLLFIV